MGFSIPDCFMIAFTVGLIFGLVYEALRIIRLIMQLKAVTFACDVLFFLLAAWAVCMLSKSLGNYIRVYTILGFGAGVFTYIVTVGRLLNIAESAASNAWRRFLGKTFRKIMGSTKKCFVSIAQISSKELCKTAKHLEIYREKCFRHLKKDSKVLYNKDISEKIGEGEKSHVIKAKITRSP